ncbi:hypothetical protein MNBD_ALPHA11-1365 [hydrothermal vent metagenome]|uniref:Uncharacterized protein n=1 Tax=hydrothermal vent metagenome TaxID=652676 RepID=A0A3B0TJZ4_9ZZZZ
MKTFYYLQCFLKLGGFFGKLHLYFTRFMRCCQKLRPQK